MGHIVVGVDGSKQCVAALEWAADQARARNAVLHVVNVYRAHEDANPYDVGGAGGESGVAFQEHTAQKAADWRDEHNRHEEEQARTKVDRMVAELSTRAPDDVTTATVASRKPARALLEAAQGADALVVGTRGRGGFAGLVLGSVSQQIAGHAPCPLVIVPSPDQD